MALLKLKTFSFTTVDSANGYDDRLLKVLKIDATKNIQGRTTSDQFHKIFNIIDDLIGDCDSHLFIKTNHENGEIIRHKHRLSIAGEDPDDDPNFLTNQQKRLCYYRYTVKISMKEIAIVFDVEIVTVQDHSSKGMHKYGIKDPIEDSVKLIMMKEYWDRDFPTYTDPFIKDVLAKNYTFMIGKKL